MMRLVAGLICTVFSLGGFAAEKAESFKTNREKVSYSIGMNIGGTLKQRNMDVDVKSLAEGLQAVLSGSKTLLTPEEARQVWLDYNRDLAKQQSDERKKAGETYLEKNKAREGVKTTASGLQYEVMTEGTGPKPKADDTVLLHYRGELIDGTEFDNTYKRGTGPVEVGVSRGLKGWAEALQMMPVGSKWKVYVPSELGYGERGQRPQVPPDAVLVYDMELVKIVEKPASAKPGPANAGSSNAATGSAGSTKKAK